MYTLTVAYPSFVYCIEISCPRNPFIKLTIHTCDILTIVLLVRQPYNTDSSILTVTQVVAGCM